MTGMAPQEIGEIIAPGDGYDSGPDAIAAIVLRIDHKVYSKMIQVSQEIQLRISQRRRCKRRNTSSTKLSRCSGITPSRRESGSSFTFSRRYEAVCNFLALFSQ